MRKTKYNIVATCVVAVICWGAARLHADDLAFVLDEGNIWGASPADFFSAVNPQGKPAAFDWASQTEKERARYPAWRNSPEITLFGMHLCDAVALFEDGSLARIECSLYNKGDAEINPRQGVGVIHDEETFVAMLKKSAARIDKWAGGPGKNLEPKRLTTTGIKMMRRVWTKKPYLIEMRWAFTKAGRGRDETFLGEYVTVVFSEYSRDNDPTALNISSVKDRYDGWAEDKDFSVNVKNNFQGDVYVAGIPMVNQGEKGYCVVAALERMLRYYGAEIDKHALAQLGQSSGKRGTVMGRMLDTLEEADTKLGIHVDLEYSIAEDLEDWTDLVRKYNREAGRHDKPEIKDEQWVSQEGRQRMYHISKMVSLLDSEVYISLRNKRFYADFNRFQRQVKQEISEGRPVLWGVWLGIVPENPGDRKSVV